MGQSLYNGCDEAIAVASGAVEEQENRSLLEIPNPWS